MSRKNKCICEIDEVDKNYLQKVVQVIRFCGHRSESVGLVRIRLMLSLNLNLGSESVSLSLARTTTRQTPPRHRRLRWSPMMEMWVILVVELKQKGVILNRWMRGLNGWWMRGLGLRSMWCAFSLRVKGVLRV
ncbi:hypothetical protein Hanom_Chr16g01427411 [Helianthus anomalus]